MLAQSLEGDPATASSSDTIIAAPETDKSDGSTDPATDNANALALAMFTQALAAALGASNAVQVQQGATASTSAAGSDDATEGVTDTTRSGGGQAPMQELVCLLAKDLAADAHNGGDASQTDAAAAKNSSSDAGAANTAAPGSNPLAHLGAASHFSLQHARADTNTGDLKSPLGSPELER